VLQRAKPWTPEECARQHEHDPYGARKWPPEQRITPTLWVTETGDSLCKGSGAPCLLASYEAVGIDPLTLLHHDVLCLCQFPKEHQPGSGWDHIAWMKQYHEKLDTACQIC